MRNTLVGICTFLLMCQAYAQYDFGFQQEYFFGNLPSAQAEAMGRANASIGGSVASLYFNPAGIGRIEHQEIYLSTSAPFYVLRNSDYYFLGVARRINSKVVAAFSINQLAIGRTTFDVNINGLRYPLDKPSSTNIALTVAATPIDGLQVGINANLFNWKLFDEVSSSKKLHVDAGALYRLTLQESATKAQHLQFGLSVTNLSSSAITFASPMGDEASEVFPIIARGGVSYMTRTNITLPGAGTGPLAITLTTEYQNLLNSIYRTTFSLGAEALFWDAFAFRIGYITQNINDFGFTNNRDRFSDFTYGFGFQIPLEELTKGSLPFRLHWDYVSLKQPPFTFTGTRLPNMRSFSFRLVFSVPE